MVPAKDLYLWLQKPWFLHIKPHSFFHFATESSQWFLLHNPMIPAKTQRPTVPATELHGSCYDSYEEVPLVPAAELHWFLLKSPMAPATERPCYLVRGPLIPATTPMVLSTEPVVPTQTKPYFLLLSPLHHAPWILPF